LAFVRNLRAEQKKASNGQERTSADPDSFIFPYSAVADGAIFP
jgi:hypothetical protein|tara:strand:- start:1003 stop:1131 length:129 start_codon:yes stop_codon:yes gene_type:complete